MVRSLDVALGAETYKAVPLPDYCGTVGQWKELLENGHFGEKLECASRLVCRLERSNGGSAASGGGPPAATDGKAWGREGLERLPRVPRARADMVQEHVAPVLAATAPLPVPPAVLFVEGSPFLVGTVAALMARAVGRAPPPVTVGFGVAGPTSPRTPLAAGAPRPTSIGTVAATPRSPAKASDAAPHSAREPRVARISKTTFSVGHKRATNLGAYRSGRDEPAGVLDGEAAEKVLQFWFEELTTEDWFAHSHDLDDRIRRDFGGLHQRAAAGELAGWMQRPDTCLALVVILDQFSRRIYGPGTPEGCQWNGIARTAANKATDRRDDRDHWEPGPKRSALYLPFMHSDDLADKKRCVEMMRRGLPPDAEGGSSAAGGAAGVTGGGLTTPAGTGRSTSRSLRGTTTGSNLPRLVSAAPSPAAPSPRRGAPAPVPSVASAATVTSAAVAFKRCSNHPSIMAGGSPMRAAADEDENDSDSDLDLSDLNTALGGKPGSSGGGGGSINGAGSTGRQGSVSGTKAAAFSGTFNALEDPVKSYSMHVIEEQVAKLKVLALNHEHAKRFRSMKLDAQTQQTYLRDRKDVNRTVRYQCLVCSVTHEFKPTKGAAVGAE